MESALSINDSYKSSLLSTARKHAAAAPTFSPALNDRTFAF